jgi:hypothetical protein
MVGPWSKSIQLVSNIYFFTSIELAEEILNLGATIFGTLRQNKRQNPSELKPKQADKKLSSIHIFRKYMTMYQKKKSCEYFEYATDTIGKLKPEIINYYNSTKGSVDTMQQMVSNYTWKQSTRRS